MSSFLAGLSGLAGEAGKIYLSDRQGKRAVQSQLIFAQQEAARERIAQANALANQRYVQAQKTENNKFLLAASVVGLTALIILGGGSGKKKK